MYLETLAILARRCSQTRKDVFLVRLNKTIAEQQDDGICAVNFNVKLVGLIFSPAG